MTDRCNFIHLDENLKAESRFSTLSSECPLNLPEGDNENEYEENHSNESAILQKTRQKITKYEYQAICLEVLNKKRKRIQMIATRMLTPVTCNYPSSLSSDQSESERQELLQNFVNNKFDDPSMIEMASSEDSIH